jgi:hypothetical protein
MKTLYQPLLLTLGALAIAGVAYAQVPSSNDTSDGHLNTGMGTGALGGPAASNAGDYNTASGVDALFSNTTGSNNTALGLSALYSNMTGSGNIASGSYSLKANTTGNSNTASGFSALLNNTTGSGNTASGSEALLGAYDDATGSNNTAIGANALYSYSTGSKNTASGVNALYSNSTGSGNDADGYGALYENTTGDYNTAVGYETLYSNTTGTENNGAGYATLEANTTGSYNNAMGVKALFENITGSQNSAVGYGALYSNTDGNYNVGLGYFAGFNLTTGSNNIDINNRGVAGESGVIRIGIQGTQSAAYVAGIYGTTVTGSAVYVTPSGQLGVLASSERFKTAIAPMGSNSEKLQQLRPVTFQLKTDPGGTVQYGLIAEEVAKVYPELVIRDQNGRIDGVRYEELAPMLLNEVQQQQQKIAAQAAQLRDVLQQLAVLKEVSEATRVALRQLQSKDEIVAQR